jgi:GNAT superfamily N-acetyltransferase
VHSVDFPPQAEVLGLGVEPSLRGRRIGSAMLGVAEQWARRHGYLDLVVRSSAALPRVLHFYERRGYVRWRELQVLRKPLV